MLRDYEILYIVRPDLDEDQVSGVVKTVNTLIVNLGGAAQKTDVWGRRRLAYEVKHLREGQYVLQDFQIDPTRVPDMENTLRISDTVFRHLIVRKPEPRAPRAAAAEPAAPAPETPAAEGPAAEPAALAAEAPGAEAPGAEAPAAPATANEPEAAAPVPVPATAKEDPA